MAAEGQVQHRNVKLEEMLSSLIERGGYSRNRQPILDAVQISAAALSQYTRGQTRPSFQKLIDLGAFFGVSLDYLVYGEPVAPVVDPGPLARYVEHALADVQARASRHSDLLTRIGRVLADRIDGVAEELANSDTAGREGLIQHDEVLRVERYCRSADIVTMTLTLDVIQMSGANPAAGQFLQVVAANLVKGAKYRFLLPGGETAQDDTVASCRSLLAPSVPGDHLHGNLAFGRAAMPITAGAGLYELDVAVFEREEPALYTQFRSYVSDDHWLGYVTSPNVDSNADMLMSCSHAKHARAGFESLWSSRVDL
jgi:transcriptional regulator with XRE-family HTH domain